MTIAGGILQLLVILLPAILAEIARRNEVGVLISKKNEQIDKAIATADVNTITVELNTMLDQLQRDSGNTSRSTDKV